MMGSKWGGCVVKRFFSNVDMLPSGCWNWTGMVDDAGYGRFFFWKKVLAHRVAFHYWHGPIPSDLVVDHACNNRRCVRPEHLRLLTNGENLDRSPLVPWNRTNCLKCFRPIGKLYNTAKSRRGCKPCEAQKRAERLSK